VWEAEVAGRPVGEERIRIVVGLGNPGPRYALTRHNAGFMVADELAGRWGVGFREDAGPSLVGEAVVAGERVLVVKPLTFMNASGRAVGLLAAREKIVPQSVLVVYDDLHLPLGSLRIRRRGSAGGHKGMASIIEIMGTTELPRVRVGIGPPVGPAADFVLAPFSAAELVIIKTVVARAATAVEKVLREGLEPAMQEFNAKGIY